jgi:hypothetical protein
VGCSSRAATSARMAATCFGVKLHLDTFWNAGTGAEAPLPLSPEDGCSAGDETADEARPSGLSDNDEGDNAACAGVSAVEAMGRVLVQLRPVPP